MYSSGLPRRDRKYLIFICSGALVLWLFVGAYWSVPGGILGGVLTFALFQFNSRLWRIPIFPYDRILSAYSADGLEWTRDPDMRINTGGLHQSIQVYCPVVIRAKMGLRMYYRAGGNNSSIASATSADGLNWREEPGWRLQSDDALKRLEPNCVVSVGDGRWQLYYSGFDGRGWALYGAQSDDMLQWVRQGQCGGLPLAAGDVKDAHIFANDGIFRIYFRRFVGAEMSIHTGESTDGMQWFNVRRCSGYAASGYDRVSHPRVLSDGEMGWRLFFVEWSDASFIGARIASAQSSDGIHWQRDAGIRLQPGGRYDPYGAFCPDIVADAGGWRMYYGGFWERHLLQPWTLYQRRKLRNKPVEIQ